MKYKVGDKVRIRRDLSLSVSHPVVTPEMVCLAGTVHTICNEYQYLGSKVRYYLLHSNPYDWTDAMLEPIDTPTITISTDGETVTAIYLNGSEVYKATGKCMPGGEFSFIESSNIAYDRLARKINKPAWSLERFKNGRIAVNCKTEIEAAMFLTYLYMKGFSWFSSSKSLMGSNEWSIHEKDTCYSCDPKWGTKVLSCGSSQSHEYSNIPVLPFSISMLEV